MKRKKTWMAIAGLAFIMISGGLFYVALASRQPSPLVMLSSDAKFGISASCTFGTNHVYYYGDSVDRLLDPAIRRWSDTNAYRLRHHTDLPSTVVWVRLAHPDFAKPPPLVALQSGLVQWPTASAYKQFRALLMDKGGAETVLELKTSLQHYKGGYFVGGWLLSGSLEDHRGNELHIESTNGTKVVTFRIP